MKGWRKPDPAPNSIEGERSQFGLAAEGRLQQFVKLCQLQERHFLVLSPHFLEKWVAPPREIQT